jgi:hypothetical protein
MKTLVVGLLVVSVLFCPVLAQDEGQAKTKEIPGIYKYPVRPGMPEWKELRGPTERVEATQVPEHILAGMSTLALAATCWDYPMTLHVIVHNTYQEGLENIIKFSNAHQELLRREDAGVSLLRIYENLEPKNPDWSAARKGEYQFQFMTIELLLGQEEVLAGMSDAEKNRLLAAALAKYDYKQSNFGDFGPMGLETAAFLMGRILVNTGAASFSRQLGGDEKVQSLIQTGKSMDFETVSRVVDFARRHQAKVQKEVE